MESDYTYHYLGLGYVVLTVIDLEPWREFAVSFVGAEPNDSASVAGELRFKIDDRSWRIAVEPGRTDGIGVLGFEVRDRPALEEVRKRLEMAAIPGNYSPSPDELAMRSVAGLLRTEDPAGVAVEIFYGASSDYHFRPGADVSSFVTGDAGLGHAVIGVHNVDTCVEFYRDVLGFTVSDIFQRGASKAVFLRCSPREHNLALVELRPDARVPRLLHVMVEASRLDDVGKALDRAEARSVPVTVTLGQHTNDEMVSFYCSTPAAFDLEIGALGRRLPRSHPVTTMLVGDIWGHKVVPRAHQSSKT